jgi:hypothetical protein
MHELVGKVFDGVGEDIQGATGLGSDAATAVGAYTGGGNGLRGGWN